MYKYLLIFALLIGGTAYAQNHWEIIYQSSAVHGYDLVFVNPSIGWSCTYLQPYDLYKTTNGGYTWAGRNLGLRGCCIAFYDELRGVYSDGGHTAITFDGGETWTIYTQPADMGVEGVVFLDSLTLIGTSNRIWGVDSTRRQIARSTDGGITWESLFAEVCLHSFGKPVFTLNGTILITGGSANEVWRSIDYGDSWQVIRTDVPTIFSAIAATDSTVYFRTVFGAFSGPPAIARSTDDGFTWQEVWAGDSALPRPFWLWDIIFTDPLHGWVCGDGGLMVQTTDGGDTWTSYYLTGSAYGIAAMSFMDSTLGWGIDPELSQTILYRWSTVNNMSGAWQSSSVANQLRILNIYPNPFNSATTFRFNVSRKDRVVVEVYDILGHSVGVITDRVFTPGIYQLNWKGADYASGVYFLSVTDGYQTVTSKLHLVK